MAKHGTHNDLHADQGAQPGEHPGRAANPVIKVRDIAWLEFEKPDLKRALLFAEAFGFATMTHTPDELVLRGSDQGSPAVVIRRGPRSRYVGAAFSAADRHDVVRVADAHRVALAPLPENIGGVTADLTDPSGARVRIVADVHQLPGLDDQIAHPLNFGHDAVRVNAPQRPARLPSNVQRLGHVVLQTTSYRRTLDWYLQNLGMIVSDFKYFAGQRHRGPTMSFIRCDRGAEPADHHTLAMTLGPRNRYVHSAYQVADLDALAAGGEYLRDRGYYRSWGIGRHIEGSQIFDYWRDPDGFLVEHFTDGDLFDNTLQTGWSPMTASGLAQWGPAPTADFLGVRPGRESLRELASIMGALRGDNEFDLGRLAGLLKVARS
ncbi:MAG: VOC family protein [Marmoricola sp.]